MTELSINALITVCPLANASFLGMLLLESHPSLHCSLRGSFVLLSEVHLFKLDLILIWNVYHMLIVLYSDLDTHLLDREVQLVLTFGTFFSSMRNAVTLIPMPQPYCLSPFILFLTNLATWLRIMLPC